MQTLIQFVFLAVFTASLGAQPATPQPPKTPTTSTSNHNSSISVSKTDEDYRIKARFNKSRYDAVKYLLVNQLGKEGLTIKRNTYTWSHGSNDFTCKLTSTSLRLYMDYESNSDTFTKHVERIGSQLKYAVSGSDPEEDIKKAEEDVARAKRELEEAKKRLKQKRN